MEFRKLEEADKDWVNEFIREHWGSEQVVVHDTIYLPCCMDGFVAEDNNSKAGLITYIIQNNKCEIVTLNSIIEHKGYGRNLIDLVVNEATEKRCEIIWLITTNDNIRGIEFYLKYGFKLKKVYYNAVNNSRKIKPEIPLIAENGIAITDEFEFVLPLNQ